ncbi:MAG: ornithine--oxo-acid transaminase [Planctomycetes bacterium]|nr:ornithine--oxo-acid transaminase [Planctomycetota bacterium]
MKSQKFIDVTEKYGAQNYKPIPVVISHAKGVWVWDADGKKYIDMLSSYSALNQGHLHPAIIKAVKQQLGRVTLTSRAFYNDRIGEFFKAVTGACKMDKVLPMNSGAEAVETAIKLARKWGHTVKGIPENSAEIICCKDNFHGRTTTVISFSTEPQYRAGFGPFTPGFKIIEYGNAEDLEKAITPNTAAFLVEPIQGEAGIVMPPAGYLRKTREICSAHNVLFIADEIQTGFGRTGKLFCCEHEGVKPDVLIIGKALGGGIMPVSGVLSSAEIMSVFKPGDHGSTFGGNPLACAVGIAAINVLIKEKLVQNSAKMGAYFINELKKLQSPIVKDIRGKGLFIGVEIKKECGTARKYCEQLMHLGVLSKETHDQVIRFAPPLNIKKQEIDWALERIKSILINN